MYNDDNKQFKKNNLQARIKALFFSLLMMVNFSACSKNDTRADDLNDAWSTILQLEQLSNLFEGKSEREWHAIRHNGELSLIEVTPEFCAITGLNKEDFENIQDIFSGEDLNLDGKNITIDELNDILNKVQKNIEEYMENIPSDIRADVIKYIKDPAKLSADEMYGEFVYYIRTRSAEPFHGRNSLAIQFIRDNIKARNITIYQVVDNESSYARIVPTTVGDVVIPKGEAGAICSLSYEEFKDITGYTIDEYVAAINANKDGVITIDEVIEQIMVKRSNDIGDQEIGE